MTAGKSSPVLAAEFPEEQIDAENCFFNF